MVAFYVCRGGACPLLSAPQGRRAASEERRAAAPAGQHGPRFVQPPFCTLCMSPGQRPTTVAGGGQGVGTIASHFMHILCLFMEACKTWGLGSSLWLPSLSCPFLTQLFTSPCPSSCSTARASASCLPPGPPAPKRLLFLTPTSCPHPHP